MNKAGNIIREKYEDGDLLWILHEHTLLHVNSKIKNLKFNLTMYELHKDIFKENSKLKNRIKWADKVVVPEYSRAAIVQACIGLQDLPYVIPNKPYEFDDAVMCLEVNPILEIEKSAHLAGKLLLLYTGIFLRERKLDTILEAANQLQDKYEVVLIGKKTEYLEELLTKYPQANFLGFMPAPTHLDVVRHADVGVLTYVSDSGSINPVFCAPNKIWEYTKYGIPMICNDIPGLKYTVEYNGCGVCAEINSVEDIKNKLEDIYCRYQEYSQNALSFYDSVNIEKIISDFVDME